MGEARDGRLIGATLAELELDLSATRGALLLRAALQFGTGWTALFGPSGSGKSTILRLIAGLERPDTGRITIDGTVLTNTAQHVQVPPHQRGIRMVMQRPALFSHMSVQHNLHFAAHNPSRVADAVRLCRIGPLLDRGIGQLSGGERQRVALARTLAADPGRCLLLDEPFTGLDTSLRDALLADVRAWLQPQAIPVILVTHDLGEVFQSARRVVRIQEGRIVGDGTPEVILAPERTALLRGLGSA